MNSLEFHDLLLTQLRAELARRYGEQAVIEERMKRRRGYLSRSLCSGSRMPLASVLDAVDAMGIAIPDFLSRALDLKPRPELKLWDVVPRKPQGRPLALLNQTSDRLITEAAEEPSDVSVSILRDPAVVTPAIQRKLASIERLKPQGLARALTSSRKYRDVTFARCYIKQLKEAANTAPEMAERVGVVIACRMVPNLPSSPRSRLAFFCWALCLVAHARHVRGDLAFAATILLRALSITESFKIDDVRGRLLWRTALLLRDMGHQDAALEATSKALALFADNGSYRDIASTTIVRGIILVRCSESLEQAVQSLRLGLSLLDNAGSVGRWRFLALFALCSALRRLKRLDEASQYLEKAVEETNGLGAGLRAKILWEAGCLLAEQHELHRAEAKLRQAQQLLASLQLPEAALAAVDIGRVLLALGRDQDVRDYVATLPALLKLFPGNRAAQRAVSELVQAALANRVSQRVLIVTRNKLRKAGPSHLSVGPAPTF